MEKEFEKWMKKAEKEVNTAKANLDIGEYEACAFFSHQAAEKALKALYILKFKRLWKTHDLVGLLAKLGGKALEKECEELNRHYIETRYVVETEYTKEIAEKAVKTAEKVMAWAKEKLKG